MGVSGDVVFYPDTIIYPDSVTIPNYLGDTSLPYFTMTTPEPLLTASIISWPIGTLSANTVAGAVLGALDYAPEDLTKQAKLDLIRKVLQEIVPGLI